MSAKWAKTDGPGGPLKYKKSPRGSSPTEGGEMLRMLRKKNLIWDLTKILAYAKIFC